MTALVRRLDEAAGRAVPPAIVERLDGWVVRCSPGLATKRVNSVWPRADDRGLGLEAKLAIVERWYAERGQPARFQLSPAAQPPGIDAVLAARGYRRTDETTVQIADIADAETRTCDPGATVEIDSVLGAGWLTVWQAALGLTDDRVHGAVDLMRRISAPTAFGTAYLGGEAAAVALGVLDGDWLGIFNMATLPAARRRGAGRAAVGALAHWARRGGASGAYLQVETTNEAALGLYRSAGYTTAYRYAYRTLVRA